MSLLVIGEQEKAMAKGQDRLMQELTSTALQAAAIPLDAPAAHLHLDNEHSCLRADAGNWQQRLTRQRKFRP